MSQALVELLHNRVLAEEIDELGHFSVPFYEARAMIASRRLITDLGCDLEALAVQGMQLTLVDAYLRNFREQFEGAPIKVCGGVLDVSATRLRIYQELLNAEQLELSAAFVYEFELRSTGIGAAIEFPTSFLERATSARVNWPEHGQPRSIELDREPHALTLADAQNLGLAVTGPRVVEPDECDDDGLFLRDHFTSLPYSGFDDDDQSLEWVFDTDDGRRLGLADLESRNVLYDLPRVREQIQVFSCNVQLGEKVLQRAHWVFNLTTEKLASIAMTVSIPLDLAARKSAPFPPELRAKLEAQYHPELY